MCYDRSIGEDFMHNFVDGLIVFTIVVSIGAFIIARLVGKSPRE